MFSDLGGTCQRLDGKAESAAKITVAVMVTEDVPQLVLIALYMRTMVKAAGYEIDTISWISLAGSVFNLFYCLYMVLIADRRMTRASKTSRETNDGIRAQEAGARAAAPQAATVVPTKKAWQTSNNPTFSPTLKQPAAVHVPVPNKVAGGIQRQSAARQGGSVYTGFGGDSEETGV